MAQDPHDEQLLANVQPARWSNPAPAPRYHLVIVGAGTAGLVTAAAAAGLGARVALVERGRLGGDCLNFGCVPSKALLRAARAVADARGAAEFGVRGAENVRVDFAAVMERMRRLRANISEHDSARRFRGLGVDVFLGAARFCSRDAVQVADATLRFRRAVIATGTRPSVPLVPGLAEAGFLTNETVFSLTTLPARLAVIGGGPIGCELAQAFARFGAHVTLLQRGDQLLPRDDPDGARIVEAALRRDGVDVRLGCEVREVRSENGKQLAFACQGGTETLHVDEILVAAGRTPNVHELDLAAAGVAFDERLGVHVNDRLQTSNRHVYAAGDVCSAFKFTHAADAMARIVVRNALFLGRARMSRLSIPWCTYTDPEIAQVGMTERQAAEAGIRIQSFIQEMKTVDRAVLDGDTEGFIKVHVQSGSDRILGVTIVARHAGEMISEANLARVAGVGLGKLSGVIHPYPTQAEALRKLGDQYMRTRLTPLVKWVLQKWLNWRL